LTAKGLEVGLAATVQTSGVFELKVTCRPDASVVEVIALVPADKLVSLGVENVIACGSLSMKMERVFVSLVWLPLATVNVTLKVPEAVGVPDSAPVSMFRLTPSGKPPALNVQLLYVPPPRDAVRASV
jgi:hypothetical protein